MLINQYISKFLTNQSLIELIFNSFFNQELKEHTLPALLTHLSNKSILIGICKKCNTELLILMGAMIFKLILLCFDKLLISLFSSNNFKTI